ncbi:MAG: FG-GAP-like repeat-containing protein [Candidatus Njordarchaeum guaymaensis]
MFGGDGYAYALNGEDGSLLWRFRAGQQVLSSAALADVDDDGRLEVIFGVIGSSQKYGYIYTLNGEDGSILWKRKIEEKGKYFYGRYPAFSSPVLGDIDGDGRLEIILSSYIRWIFALNGEDGSILWKYYVGTWSRCSPVIGDLDRDNQLDVLFNSGYEFYAIDGKRGEIIWKTYFCTDIHEWWSLLLADLNKDNELEFITTNTLANKVYVFRVSGSGFRAYWPRANGDEKLTGNIINVDSDLDYLSDSSERNVGTDPRNWDTDSDRMPDGWEVTYGLNATNPIDAGLDPDNDTLTNLEEYHLGTDPLCVDTDGDGIADAEDKHPTVYDKSLSEYLGDIAEGISEFFVRNLTAIVLTVSIAILLVTLYTGLREGKKE